MPANSKGDKMTTGMDYNNPDYETSKNILSLIGKNLTRKVWDSWQNIQRIRAVKYAFAVHLSASDNIVRKKELVEPIFVKRLKETK